jgi:hypothetical protein
MERAFVVGIVAIRFIGPSKLPDVLRALGQWMSKNRRFRIWFRPSFSHVRFQLE